MIMTYQCHSGNVAGEHFKNMIKYISAVASNYMLLMENLTFPFNKNHWVKLLGSTLQI